MSKNYELLQQVEFGLSATPALTTGQDGVAALDLAAPASRALSSLEPAVREEAQKLVQFLFLGCHKAAPKAVVFAAVDANIGCSWLSAVTAKVLASSVPGSVCLVEGNLRSPSLARALGVDCDRGLVDSLREDGSIREFTKQIGMERVWLLSAGTPVQDSMTLLNSDRIKERVGELRLGFDYLIMDAPPMNSFADGMALGRLVDGVVLVLEANSTRREAALRVTESLRTTKIPILGAVLNNRTFPIPEAVYKRL
jgi:Mrp family chromosome partitioning ATPase